MIIQSSEHICTRRGFPVILQHLGQDKQNSFPVNWCVQHAGNGHYFETKEDAEDYLECRKFNRTKRSVLGICTQ